VPKKTQKWGEILGVEQSAAGSGEKATGSGLCIVASARGTAPGFYRQDAKSAEDAKRGARERAN